jgi:flagellar biosynthetic protein FlhB
MPDQDKHSRTEKPTTRRKKDARREGQVARTPELVTWLVIMSGTFLVQYTVKTAYVSVDKLWYQVGDAISRPSITTDIAVAGQGGKDILSCLAPAVLTTMALALLVNLAQTRGLVTFKPLKPSFSKVNPVNGLKRLFSPRSLWEAAKQTLRVILLTLVAWKTVIGFVPVATAAGPLSSMAIASMVATRALSLTRQVAAIGLGLAVMDYVVQYRKTARQMRMTKQEVREDSKATEGNPLVRGAIRRRQRQMARNRMLAAVARADAVVLNPTHFAVAVSYVRGRGAPKVVAKGVDFLALRIRDEATAHRVPLVEDPPLARALYVACEVEQEIPTALYEAVARLLTFIYSLKASGRATRIDGAPHKPAAPLLALSSSSAFDGR